MTAQSSQVDGYLRKQKQWAAELAALRGVVLGFDELAETVKWRVPCYTLEGANVVLLNALKDYCAVGFMKGALLKDPKGILETPGPNTQAARLVRFTCVAEVAQRTPALKALIREAIRVERAGLRVELKPIDERAVPTELASVLAERPEVKAAFAALTPGRRRGYLMHIAGAKQSSTRAARVERCLPRILAGRGLQDR